MADPPPEAVVLVVSTRVAAGTMPDSVGPDLVARLREAGWDVVPTPSVVADGEATVSAALTQLTSAGHRLIVTTGGTGLTPTDRTPEATRKVAAFEVPGLGELMRRAGAASTIHAALSRGVVAARQRTLIVNLPGSPAGAAESLTAVLPVLRHAVDQLEGGNHH
jgi:molybdenum cofactor synthesis domain-containing protein